MANRKKIVGTMVVVTNGAITGQAVEVRDVAREAHRALGDYFEGVPFFYEYKGKRCFAFVGENGKGRGLPRNEKATAMWHLLFPPPRNQDYIVGPMVIVYGDDAFMSEL